MVTKVIAHPVRINKCKHATTFNSRGGNLQYKRTFISGANEEDLIPPQWELQQQYVNMYMRRLMALATIGHEDDNREEKEGAAILSNAISRVKEFAQIMEHFKL